jgi:hypothetical protein
MYATCSCEMSIDIQKSVRRYIPENRILNNFKPDMSLSSPPPHGTNWEHVKGVHKIWYYKIKTNFLYSYFS